MPWPRQCTVLAATVVLAILAASCAADRTVSAQDAPLSHHVRIGLTEWSVVTGPQRFAAGSVTALVTNAGSTTHDLRIEGPRVAVQTRLLRPGQQAVLRFTTRPGQALRLWCTVPGHDEAGMDITRHVARRES